MKRALRVAVIAAAFAAFSSPAPGRAQEIGHYAPGVYNIRDFFVPDPGWYFTVYNVFYTTDTLRDRSGDKVRSITIGPGGGVTLGVDVDVDVYTLAPTVIGVAPWELPWDGRYGAFITPTFANNSVSTALSAETGAGLKADEGQFGVGDLYVQPIWLGWSGDHWDFSLSYGFYAPVGKYDTDKVSFPLLGFTVESPSADNIGLGFWTHQFQTAGAWYPWKHRATAVAMAVTGEVHGKKRSIDVTPGSHVSWNWGISQYLPLTKDEKVLLELGPAGYSQWQVSDDSGSAARNRSVHDQVHAAGLQLGLTHVPWMASLTAKYLHEFRAEDRFEGQVVTLSVAKSF
ncbi:MAG: transporter [Chromatiales bacterium]|jgi:hypothetical protein